jgi:hypothetical protein
MHFEPGDIPIHLLAMGATEFYGPNRNGDGFKKAMLEEYHPTFVKHARYYYNHANKDPLKSYGYVKSSAYHPSMHRVELLVCLNGTKEAAARNRGFVAEKDLDDLENGRDIPVSMAIKVPYDVCSGCGNRAKTREEYCTGRTCKYGGLLENISKVASDGHILHADNTEGTFFDISRVWRPADRIAYVFGRIKAAGDFSGIGGAALAEAMGVSSPHDLLADLDHPGVKLAYELAALEREVEKEGANRWGLAFADEVRVPVDWKSAGGSYRQVLAALALEKVAVPLRDFFAMAGTEGVTDAALDVVASRLPGVFGRMIEDGSIAKLASNNPFVPQSTLPPARVREWARKVAADHALVRPSIERRIKVAAVRRAGRLTGTRHTTTIKVAGDAEGLARTYALYKLGMLQTLEGSPGSRYSADCDKGFQLTALLAVRQNYTSS